jgi:GT2 family glycosyltransferase
MTSSPMRSSVVIATAGRPEGLAGCLAALAADVPSAPREVLVVDNAPTGAAGEATARVTARFGARRIPEARPGKSHALNTGIAEATGDVVLFTDDDVRVQPGWTDALVAAATRPGVGVVGGRLLPRWTTPPPAWLAGPHAVHLTLRDHGPHDRPLPAPEFPYGAAMAVPAAVLRDHAPAFDPRLGPRPGLKLGHEEVHLVERVRRQGLAVVHCAAAVAEHCIDPARVDRRQLRRLVLQSGVGAARRERLLGAPAGPLPRRLAETGVSLARAARTAAVRGPVSAGQVDRETGAWAVLGQRIERLAGGPAPGAVDWLAARLAGQGPA